MGRPHRGHIFAWNHSLEDHSCECGLLLSQWLSRNVAEAGADQSRDPALDPAGQA